MVPRGVCDTFSSCQLRLVEDVSEKRWKIKGGWDVDSYVWTKFWVDSGGVAFPKKKKKN